MVIIFFAIATFSFSIHVLRNQISPNATIAALKLVLQFGSARSGGALSCSQGTQLLSRKKNGFLSELLSNSEKQARSYKGEVKSHLVTGYIKGRFVVPIGKGKPEQAFCSRLLK